MRAKRKRCAGIGRLCAVMLAVLGLSGCAALRSASSPVQGNRSADTEAARSLPAAPEPREVRVSLARDGLGGVLRERYLGAWVRVQPPGQFLKSLIRIEIPSDQRDAFLCAVGSDYLGVCRPPPSREMRTYPLSQVQVILGAHCGKAGACATPPR